MGSNLMALNNKSGIIVSIPAPSGDTEGECVLCQLEASGNPQQPLNCRHIALVSASIFTWPSPLRLLPFYLLERSVIGFRVQPNAGWSYLYILNCICKDPFTKQYHIHGYWSLRLRHTLGGGCHSSVCSHFWHILL